MTSAFFDPRPEGFEPTTIGIGIRYSIRAELRTDDFASDSISQIKPKSKSRAAIIFRIKRLVSPLYAYSPTFIKIVFFVIIALTAVITPYPYPASDVAVLFAAYRLRRAFFRYQSSDLPREIFVLHVLQNHIARHVMPQDGFL